MSKPAAVAAQSSVGPAANTSGPAAQKSTQQQQALTSCAPTQTPSTNHRARARASRWAQLSALKSGRLAGSRRFWLLAPGFMASGRFCLVPHRPPKFLGLRRNRDGRWAAKISGPAAQCITMGDGSAQCTGRKTTRRPAPSLQAGELSRSSS